MRDETRMSPTTPDISSPPADAANAFPAVEVSPARAPEAWTARIALPTGERVALHSARNPLAEAQLQLSAVDANAASPAVVVLVGAGLGFVTEAAHRRWPTARIVVLEPSSELARHARARTPDLYTSGTVQLLAGPDYEGTRPLWQLLDTRDGSEPPIVVHPVIARVAPRASALAEACARRAILAAQMNERAREENAGRYLLHTLKNLPFIVRGADPAALRGRFAGVPVIVVAAGPSLDRQLPALRRLATRALVIAADTAWRPLATAGIDPHIVVAVDPTDMNGRHLLRVPARRRPWLLAEPSVDPRVPPVFAGRFAPFRVANHHPWPWLGTLGIERPLVRVWGSVVTAACDLALTFGANPMLFVATDLAFTNDRPYCRGTTFEEEWARPAAYGVSLRRTWDTTLASKTLLTMPDVHGAEAATAPHLVEFRDWLVARSIEHQDRRFINTTEAGILVGPRIEQSNLESTLDAYPDRDEELRALLNSVLEGSVRTTLADKARRAIDAVEREAASAPRERITGLLADWLEFGRPSLTLADVHAALRACQRALDEPLVLPPESHVPSTDGTGSATLPLRMHTADRVARMRARLTGDPTCLAGTSPDASIDRPTAAMQLAGVQQAFIQLLAIESPLVTPAGDAAAGGGAASNATEGDPTIPLSYRFAWTPEAAPFIAAVEEAMLDTPRRPLHDALFWSGPITSTLEVDEEPAAAAADLSPLSVDPGPADPAQAETAMHVSLARSAMDLHEALGAPATRRDARVLHVIARGLAEAGAQASPRTASGLRLRDWHVPLPLRVDAFMRALTGTLVAVSGHELAPGTPRQPHLIETTSSGAVAGRPEDPRLIFLRDDAVFIEPEILTESGLPPGWVCATVDAQWASVLPCSGKESLRIRADGYFEAHTAWPFELTGEIPWGTEGGALGWHRRASLLWLRAARGADAMVASVPFHPFRVAVGPAGTAFWLGDQGGLWEWVPGKPGRLITETPMCGGLEIDGEDFILYPMERDAQNRVVPRRFAHAWRYETAARRLQRIALPAEAHCSTLTVGDDWTARASTFAGRIALTHRDGRSAALACHAPFGVAWAGSSLVVTTMDAEVLLFRDLQQHLPRES
jgi:hypothetical protein